MWAFLLVFFFVSQVVQNAMFVAQMAFFAKVGASLFAGESSGAASKLCTLAPRLRRAAYRVASVGVVCTRVVPRRVRDRERAAKQVSDPTIGGTYMTLLNTVANLGAKWPSTLVLALVDVVAVPGTLDGYHVLNIMCTLAGILWLLVMHKRVALLVPCQRLPPSTAPPPSPPLNFLNGACSARATRPDKRQLLPLALRG